MGHSFINREHVLSAISKNYLFQAPIIEMNVDIQIEQVDEPTPADGMKVLSEDIQRRVLNGFAAAISDRDKFADRIVEKALGDLEKNSKDVLFAMIGFSNRWNKLEIDHCNGRAGGSVIGDITRTTFKDAAIKFIEENKKKIFVVTSTEKAQIIATLRKEFISTLREETKLVAANTARSFLEDEADKLTEEFRKSNLLGVAKRLSDT